MIAFSGIDCAGKSTQIELVADALKKQGIKCRVIHSRGGYTPVLEWLKTLVRKDKHSTSEKQDEYRAQVHGNPRKRKLLLWLSIFDLALYYGIYFRLTELFCITILADRYFLDTFIDFHLKYPELPFENWMIWRFAKKMYLKPKKSIIYTIPAELSMYRSTLKDEPWPEPIEVRSVRIDAYMREIKKQRWDTVIDATGTIDEVFAQTMEYIIK